MGIFTSKSWIDVLTETKHFVRCKTFLINDKNISLVEWRFFGLKCWILYGEFEERMAEGLTDIFHAACREQVDFVESNFNMARWKNRVLLEKQARITMEFGTYQVDLTQSEEKLWQQVHSKHRNVIRRALKEGVEVRMDLDLLLFEDIMNYAYVKGGKRNTFNLNYLKSIEKNLKGKVIMTGAYKEGVLQSGIIVPFDDRRGYYLHGATAEKAILGSSNLLQWEIMKELKAREVQSYDLGGARRKTDDSRLRGIFKFKERFGGRFVECYYWERVFYPIRHAILKYLQNGKAK